MFSAVRESLLLLAFVLLISTASAASSNKKPKTDPAWDNADEAFQKCLDNGVEKLGCYRLQEAVEDVFNNIGNTYAFALNRTSSEVLDLMSSGLYKLQWNMIVNNLIGWMGQTRNYNPKKLRERLNQQFSSYFLKLVVNNRPEGDKARDFDPEVIERFLYNQQQQPQAPPPEPEQTQGECPDTQAPEPGKLEPEVQPLISDEL